MLERGKNIEFDILMPRLNIAQEKQLIAALAQRAAPYCLTNETVLTTLLTEQEKRANSAQGDGCAVFHLQMKGPQKPLYMLASLNHEIDMNASDGQYVDLAAMVISPLKDGPLHLRRLSRLSRLLANKTLQTRLREAKDVSAMRAILIDPDGWMMAA